MKLEKGQYIECALKNGWVVSGTVDNFNSTGLQLTRSDGKGIVIILRPNEEISVIKIPTPEPTEVQEIKEIPIASPKPQYNAVLEQPDLDDPAKIKTLVELRKEYLNQEKEEIANKLRSHEVGEVKEVRYGYPGFFKKPGA